LGLWKCKNDLNSSLDILDHASDLRAHTPTARGIEKSDQKVFNKETAKPKIKL